ncbi:DNA-(apurinic or apyrimidinic site) lyase APN1 [Aspergillus saccharolyticus JOP 1030-1]|uniref:Apurinic-apyrimidinic endonuclease 1 n=1 Tax=Aspergillus saccharolyticus JOP 1030-1 TaxID=1450539 RepID=A0A318ZKN4_9EURO|nr:AP endonuclease [Aspergillus saccharolyticus JOP 1030-1]PYH45113.1 AP endonuclease [Aspergillus saccharolyticus JOP 1030-1]
MPSRGTRQAASNAVAASPPRSPEDHKRKLADEGREQASPLRRSKRVKSTGHTETPLSAPLSKTETNKGIRSTTAASPRNNTARAGEVAAIAVKHEVEEEVETAIIGKDSTEEKDSLVKEEGIEEKSVETVKVSRKRKPKEEVEMLPLRPRTQGLRMLVGAHVSAAKGVFNSVNNSMHIGGNAFALFLKSQRKWDNPPLQDDHRDQFRALCEEHKYDAAKHILPHGSYLVNLAQEDKAKAKQAYDSFLDDLRRCEALGIQLYNFHPGSANSTPHASAITRLASALTSALRATDSVIPVLETMCGHGSTIGGSLSEFKELLAQIPADLHPRIGICIDTCHSFAAGYDLVTPSGFAAFMQEFEDLIGIQHLRALHLNDSKAPRGSKRDLHANIGTGFLGLRAFHNVMNEKRFEGVPMILETPIDRPETNSAVKNESGDEGQAKGKKKATAKKRTGASAKLVPDHSVWAKEIELLESLIGMDPDGEEFQALETKLADEGREMREKQIEQYLRKLEAEEKKAAKGSGANKGQKTLMEMMNAAGKKKGKTMKKKKDESDVEDEEGCQSHSED